MTEATMANNSVKFNNEGEGFLFSHLRKQRQMQGNRNGKWQRRFFRIAANAAMVLSVVYKAVNFRLKH